MTSTAESAAAPPPSSYLDTIKDDLGIPPDDASQDAWLVRRVNGIWARFQQYTARPLLLSATWADDWGRLVTNHPAWTEPPPWRSQPSASVFLRVFPVQGIASLTLNGETVDPLRLIVEPESGKLVGLDGIACDLRTALIGGRALIEYDAGFETLPADLYEALLGVLAPLWGARNAQAQGLPGMAARISTTDVGEVEFSNSGNVFVEATMKGVRITDPLLGPYAMLLDSYVDWRTMIGGAYPATVALQAAPLAGQLDFSKAFNSQYIPLI